MLKEILKEKDLSVYKLAKESGIPYTTVNEIVLGKKDPKDCSLKTIAALANYLNVPIKSLMEDKKIKVSSSWLDAKDKKYIFPVISKTELFAISRIHPLKQKVAVRIAEAIKNDKRIKCAYIFGGSTTIRCHSKSDIDIGIELIDDSNETKNEISEIIQEIADYNADIIWINNLEKNSRIYSNIKKGVSIYE